MRLAEQHREVTYQTPVERANEALPDPREGIKRRMRVLEQEECVCEMYLCPSCIAIADLRRQLHALGVAA